MVNSEIATVVSDRALPGSSPLPGPSAHVIFAWLIDLILAYTSTVNTQFPIFDLPIFWAEFKAAGGRKESMSLPGQCAVAVMEVRSFTSTESYGYVPDDLRRPGALDFPTTRSSSGTTNKPWEIFATALDSTSAP